MVKVVVDPTKPSSPSYTSVFGKTLVELARNDEKIVGITAAMLDGTGMNFFQKAFPDRCFDVGIAEQHAVTFAAGLAAQGMRPVCASTAPSCSGLRPGGPRCLHPGPARDLRPGSRGHRGRRRPTHHGLYDLAYLRCLPISSSWRRRTRTSCAGC